jgi:hypothetical protein
VYRRGHVGCLADTQVVCGRLVRVRAGTEQRDRGPQGRGGSDRPERVVRRLGAGFCGDELAEYVIDPAEQRRGCRG